MMLFWYVFLMFIGIYGFILSVFIQKAMQKHKRNKIKRKITYAKDVTYRVGD